MSSPTESTTNTSTPAPEVVILATPGEQTAEIQREFAAPPAAVFRAHVDPDLFVRWVGPDDITSQVQEWDARTGGHWRYVSRRGSEEFGFFGSFHEIRPDERIVQTFTFSGWPDAVSLETATFTDLPGDRSLLRAVSVFTSVAERDAMIASGMESGLVQGYRALDALLADPA